MRGARRGYPLTGGQVIVRIAVAALGLLLLVSCGSRAASGGLSDLRGRTCLSTAVTENGQAKALVAGTRIRLNFDDEGRRIGANAGCNHMGGEARVENGRTIEITGQWLRSWRRYTTWRSSPVRLPAWFTANEPHVREFRYALELEQVALPG